MNNSVTLFQIRYIDDIFMTTNQTIDDISSILVKMQKKDINIKITHNINTSVDFLDVTMSNEDGLLRTTIFHKPTAEPYILPYTSDHPAHIRRNIPYANLLRAARICSHVKDFNIERIRIDMSLLLNKYPPAFIQKQFNRFFQVNNTTTILHELNQLVYNQLHKTLLYQPTRREKQLAKMTQDPIRNPLVLQTKKWNSLLLFPRYTFDSGLSKTFPSKFITWWKKYYAFPGSPLEQVTIKIVANTNHTTEQYIIHKKPDKSITTIIES